MDFALFEAARNFNYLTGDSKLDDDFVDRINRYWSALIMVLFAIILSARQIVGDPLKCWTPQEFKKPWIEYAEDYCWVKNTYFVPKSEELPDTKQARQDQELIYYQWIPYVLTLQAFMYYLPAMLWRMLNWKCGLDLTTIVTKATKHENLKGIAYQLSSNFAARSKTEKNDFFVQRNFLTCLYLLVKILYAANAIFQFFLLSSFFGGGCGALFRVTHDLAQGNEWHETGHFPRVTFCDFSIRRFGQPSNSYSIQCLLTINIFTEKIFVFAGFWMLLVAVITSLNAFNWFIAVLLPWRKRKFMSSLLPELYRRQITNFLQYRIRSDGLVILHLIADNADDIIAAKVADMVWKEYDDELNKVDDSNDSNATEQTPGDLEMTGGSELPSYDEKENMMNDSTLPVRGKTGITV